MTLLNLYNHLPMVGAIVYHLDFSGGKLRTEKINSLFNIAQMKVMGV
jgi:hypothetical protein